MAANVLRKQSTVLKTQRLFADMTRIVQILAVCKFFDGPCYARELSQHAHIALLPLMRIPKNFFFICQGGDIGGAFGIRQQEKISRAFCGRVFFRFVP
jgi:hypothetical protein